MIILWMRDCESVCSHLAGLFCSVFVKDVVKYTWHKVKGPDGEDKTVSLSVLPLSLP